MGNHLTKADKQQGVVYSDKMLTVIVNAVCVCVCLSSVFQGKKKNTQGCVAAAAVALHQ